MDKLSTCLRKIITLTGKQRSFCNNICITFNEKKGKSNPKPALAYSKNAITVTSQRGNVTSASIPFSEDQILACKTVILLALQTRMVFTVAKFIKNSYWWFLRQINRIGFCNTKTSYVEANLISFEFEFSSL